MFKTNIRAGARLSTEDKHTLTDKVAKMCAMDIRPFAIVDGDGFRDVAAFPY